MSTIHDVTDHGAQGDGRTNDAAAIQAAIDAAHAAGGGTVLIPSGRTFLSGSLVLRSHVELHVERGAVLQASGDWEEITERHVVTALSSGTVQDGTVASGIFLSADGARDIAISGAGVIDGGGRHWVLEDLGEIYRMPVARPFTLFFRDCEDVRITDVTFRDGALWTVRLSGCESVAIRGIRIRGDMSLPNADGIDIDRCRRVTISDCDIRCPDDGISLKACEEFPDLGPCEDVVISNCVITTRSSGVVVGVDATAPIRNVTVTGCVIRDSHRGLAVNMGQSGDFENIVFSNIVVETRLDDEAWWGGGEPIYVSAHPWHEGLGVIRHVRFSHILARSEAGVVIRGFEPGHITDVVLDDVRVELSRWTDHRGGRADNRPFVDEPDPIDEAVAGVRVVCADDVVLRDVTVAFSGERRDEYTHALAVHDAQVALVGFRGESAAPGRLDAIAVTGEGTVTGA